MPAPADIFQFLRGQLFQTPQLPSTSFRGKTIVVTGANSGLGFDCAKQMLELGVSKLILGCRSLERGETAREKLLSFGQKERDIEVWQVDMNSYDSVKTFASKVNQLSRVDSLLANAGISINEFHSAEKSESILVTNVISTFLLAFLTLPALKRTAATTGTPSRLVITGSNVHAFANHQELLTAPDGKLFATLGDPDRADMNARYFLSKLIVMMGVRQMSESVDPNQVVINCPSPGWCKTPLFRTNDGGFMGRTMLGILGRSSDLGARCLTSAAVGGKETHGQYLSECQVKNVSVWLAGDEGHQVESKVWQELLDVLRNISPGQIGV